MSDDTYTEDEIKKAWEALEAVEKILNEANEAEWEATEIEVDLTPLYNEIKKQETIIMTKRQEIAHIENYIEGMYTAIRLLKGRV